MNEKYTCVSKQCKYNEYAQFRPGNNDEKCTCEPIVVDFSILSREKELEKALRKNPKSGNRFLAMAFKSQYQIANSLITNILSSLPEHTEHEEIPLYEQPITEEETYYLNLQNVDATVDVVDGEESHSIVESQNGFSLSMLESNFESLQDIDVSLHSHVEKLVKMLRGGVHFREPLVDESKPVHKPSEKPVKKGEISLETSAGDDVVVIEDGENEKDIGHSNAEGGERVVKGDAPEYEEDPFDDKENLVLSDKAGGDKQIGGTAAIFVIEGEEQDKTQRKKTEPDVLDDIMDDDFLVEMET